MKIAVLLSLLMIATRAIAQPYVVGDRITPFALDDQHGAAQQITAVAAVILFTADMDAGSVLKEALAEQPATVLSDRHAVYVADISAMPGPIASLFAIPAMRRRPYLMFLDRDGSDTARFPRTEDKVTVLFCDQLQITRIAQFATADEIRQALGLTAQ